MANKETPSPTNTASMATVRNERFWGINIGLETLPAFTCTDYVLDIGCGTTDSKLLSSVITHAGNPYIIRSDYFESNILQNSAEKDKFVMDALHLPFADSVMAGVIVSELTPDNPYLGEQRTQLAAEIGRVLRKGGFLLLYNERLGEGDMPPGVVARYRYKPYEEVRIAPGKRAYRSSFSVYEKMREPIDVSLVGVGNRWWRKGYNDDYLRVLNDQYPVPQSNEKFKVIEDTGSYEPYPTIYQEFQNAAIKRGRWMPVVEKVDKGCDAQALIEKLKPGSGVRRSALSYSDMRIYDALRNPDICHVVGMGNEVVYLPTQQQVDFFIQIAHTTRGKNAYYIPQNIQFV